MILQDKAGTKFVIKCDCGCSGLEISKFKWDSPSLPNTEYFIYHFITSFDAEQNTVFSKWKKKLRMAWDILTTGLHRYNEICLTEEQFQELKEMLVEYE